MGRRTQAAQGVLHVILRLVIAYSRMELRLQKL